MTETKKGFSIFSYINICTIIVGVFFLVVLAVGAIVGISFTNMLYDCIMRFSRNAILVLAMLPAIRSGMGPYFGLPVGIVCGLLAEVIAIRNDFLSWGFLYVSVVLAILISIPVGYAYGKFMNAVKGKEMIVGVFTGFSFIAFFGIIWHIIVPRPNIWYWWGPDWLITTIQLDQVNANLILDKFLSFKIGQNITVPTGTLLTIFLLCFLIYLFFRSKPGIAISASGASPMFARAAGLHVENNRIVASIISTALGALGIIVYGQSFGYIQLYDAPMMMTFPAVAAVLIGGATMRRARVLHVILGAFIFNSLLASFIPMSNVLLSGTDAAVLTDVIRQVVQNGVILYALIQFCKGKQGK